jgi:hypothetical protein
LIESLASNVGVSEVIPDRGKGLANKELECDIRDIELGVTHNINAFMSSFILLRCLIISSLFLAMHL